jgi:hypothetical protein
VGGDHDGQAQQQAPPEAAAEHRGVVPVAAAVAGVLAVRGVLCVVGVLAVRGVLGVRTSRRVLTLDANAPGVPILRAAVVHPVAELTVVDDHER